MREEGREYEEESQCEGDEQQKQFVTNFGESNSPRALFGHVSGLQKSKTGENEEKKVRTSHKKRMFVVLLLFVGCLASPQLKQMNLRGASEPPRPSLRYLRRQARQANMMVIPCKRRW